MAFTPEFCSYVHVVVSVADLQHLVPITQCSLVFPGAGAVVTSNSIDVSIRLRVTASFDAVKRNFDDHLTHSCVKVF